jgi:hypothetical protein
VLVTLRHPVLRALSQWHHDKHFGTDRFPQHATFADLCRAPAPLTPRLHARELPPRYQNWYRERLWETTDGESDDVNTGPHLMSGQPWSTAAIRDYTFIGIAEFYQTSLCLLYFTLQVRVRAAVSALSSSPLSPFTCATKGTRVCHMIFSQRNLLLL